MKLNEIISALRTRWVGSTIVLLLCLALAAAVWGVRPPQYQSQVTFYVSAQDVDSATSANQGGQLSEQRTISYVELLRGQRLSAEVVRQLGLPMTPEDLTRELTVTSAADTVVISVAATDVSRERSLAIAEKIGQVFPAIVSELERPLNPRAQPQVAVRVAEAPALPDQPSSRGLSFYLLVGALAGVLLGLAYAVARNTLDTSVRTADDVERATGAARIGDIALDGSAAHSVLESGNLTQSRRSEDFRQLRANLQFANVDSNLQVVVVTSSTANEGKSTTSANLAAALAVAESRVVLIEADLRRPRASEYLGLERSVGLTSILSGRATVADVVQRWSRGGLDVIASGPNPPNPSELLGSRRMRAVLDELKGSYDYVIIDTPPILAVADTRTLAPVVDGVLLVCRYGKTTSQQLESAASAVRAVSGRLVGTVVTMTPSKEQGYSDVYAGYLQVDGNETAKTVTTRVVQDPSGGSRAGGGSARHDADRRPRPRPRV